MVDSAALKEFASGITGEDGLLASTARYLLDKLGLTANQQAGDSEEDESAAVVEAVTAELGASWPKQVEPRFDERKAILLDDRWASAREDLARIFYQQEDADQVSAANFAGAGQAVARQAAWYAQKANESGKKEMADLFSAIAAQAQETQQNPSDSQDSEDSQAFAFAKDVALVTGVSAKSIAGQVVAGLLRKGASVVATSHSFSTAFIQWAKQTYRQNASGSAKLWIVPANLSSYRDVDALASWIGSEQKETHGADTTVIKPAYQPTLLYPFAAPSMHGTLADSGQLFESQARLMLWGLERLIAKLGPLGHRHGRGSSAPCDSAGVPQQGYLGRRRRLRRD